MKSEKKDVITKILNNLVDHNIHQSSVNHAFQKADNFWQLWSWFSQ